MASILYARRGTQVNDDNTVAVLQGGGHTVTEVQISTITDLNNAVGVDGAGVLNYDLCWISESINSKTWGTRTANYATAHIITEPRLIDEFGLAGASGDALADNTWTLADTAPVEFTVDPLRVYEGQADDVGVFGWLTDLAPGMVPIYERTPTDGEVPMCYAPAGSAMHGGGTFPGPRAWFGFGEGYDFADYTQEANDAILTLVDLLVPPPGEEPGEPTAVVPRLLVSSEVRGSLCAAVADGLLIHPVTHHSLLVEMEV